MMPVGGGERLEAGNGGVTARLAVLLISSDPLEVLRMVDRILVVAEGRITAELARGEDGEEAVMRAATFETQARAMLESALHSTGFALPSTTQIYLDDGTCKQHALWSSHEFGYMATCLAGILKSGKIDNTSTVDLDDILFFRKGHDDFGTAVLMDA